MSCDVMDVLPRDGGVVVSVGEEGFGFVGWYELMVDSCWW